MMPEQVARGRQLVLAEPVKAAAAAVAPTIARAARPTPIREHNPLIEQWIMETCTTCGFPELAERLSYEISSDPFFESMAATLRPIGGRMGSSHAASYKFSRVYWTLPRQLNAYRRNLVIHETCHIIANHISGRDLQHEEPWRKLMHECGQPPWTNVFTP